MGQPAAFLSRPAGVVVVFWPWSVVGHLPAGHSIHGVVHKEHGDALAPVRRVDDLSGADGGEVAVALVREDDLVRVAAAHAGGNGWSAPVRRLAAIEVPVEVRVHGAADRRDGEDAVADAELVDDFADEAVRDAVAAAGAVVRAFVTQ